MKTVARPLVVALTFGGLLFSLGLIRRRALHRAVLALEWAWTAAGFLFVQA